MGEKRFSSRKMNLPEWYIKEKEMEEIFVGNNVQEKREFLKKFIEKIIVQELSYREILEPYLYSLEYISEVFCGYLGDDRVANSPFSRCL